MLGEKIVEDLKAAMKEKDETKLIAIRMLKSAIQNKAIEKKVKSLSDEDILDLIQKQIKQRRDSIELFEKGGRQDLIAKETREIEILQQYLPKQLSSDELKKIISDAIKTVGATSAADMGKIMKEVMPKIKGKADGKEVNRVVSELLPK